MHQQRRPRMVAALASVLNSQQPHSAFRVGPKACAAVRGVAKPGSLSLGVLARADFGGFDGGVQVQFAAQVGEGSGSRDSKGFSLPVRPEARRLRDFVEKPLVEHDAGSCGDGVHKGFARGIEAELDDVEPG